MATSTGDHFEGNPTQNGPIHMVRFPHNNPRDVFWQQNGHGFVVSLTRKCEAVARVGFRERFPTPGGSSSGSWLRGEVRLVGVWRGSSRFGEISRRWLVFFYHGSPKTMKNKGLGQVKTRLSTIKSSKNVGFRVPMVLGGEKG